MIESGGGALGRRTDRYEILSEAGRGAMGVVYRALDRETGQTVALKALYGGDPDDLYRLKNEFRALAGVVHPNLVRLHEMSVDGDHGFFTMELVEGARTLVEHLRGGTASGIAPAGALREAFGQLAGALAALHAEGWLHRDLKPSNVLVDANGRVVLLDFGLVRGIAREQLERTQVGTVMGTLAYMSPEQTLGRSLSAASDWYSFGVLLYECLTGRSPFAGASAASLLDRSRLSFPPASAVAPDCDPALSALAGALLAPDPVRRPDAQRVQSAFAVAPGAERAPDDRHRTVYIGRESELARLGQAWATTRTGVATVATVEGASGLGKTALVERFIADLPSQGALVLRARCYPYELVPFEALDEVVDDLSRYLSSLPPDRLDALLPRDTSALLRLFPVLGRVGMPESEPHPGQEGAEPHEVRRRGFTALRELLARLADRRTLVIWIDDLQWADADSGPLLRELLRPPDPPRVLWLLSFRTEDRRESPLLQNLERLLDAVPSAQRQAISLAALNRAEGDALLDQLTRQRLPDAEAAALARESRGSPFLLTELLKREGSDTSGSGEEIDLDGLLRRRISRLPVEARRLLESVVVAAGPLDRGVALEAAGLGATDPNLALLLERARFLRAAAGQGRSRLEIYHDQIRETIARQLSSDDRRARHAEIASALERRGSDDAALLFTHHAGAGNRASASRYALSAADHAERQLAFDQAARFYRAALDQGEASVDAARTRVLLAEALANSGRGPEAAAAFEEAAAVVSSDESELLRQRAAEQYLVCGQIPEGTRVLLPLLESHGVHYPKTSGGARVALLASLPRLALRYFGPQRGAAPASAEQLARVDACNSASRGLLVVDPARAAYFSVRSLSDALRCGDTYRVVRGLSFTGSAFAPIGGLVGRWARSMISRAGGMVEGVRDPRLEGMVLAAQAQVSFVTGRFAEMLDLCDRSSRLLLEHCRGLRWDVDVAQMGALRALEELGRIDELYARLPGLIEDALSLDDLYAEVTFRLYDSYWKISRGEIDGARKAAHDVLERWGRAEFQLQHLYALRIQICCDVYEGATREAWARLQRAWPEIERSGLLAHLMLKSDALTLRARVALAAGEDVEREAARGARALEQMQRPDSIASASMLRAAAMARLGDRPAACAELERAEASYSKASMALHVWYAR